MVRVVPTLLVLLFVTLAVPVGAVPSEGMVAAGEGEFSRCGGLDIVVQAALAVRGHVTDPGWSLEAVAVTRDACPEAVVDTFTSSSWDPALGGCLASTTQPNATLCLEDPTPADGLVRYDLTWSHGSFYRYYGVDGVAKVGIGVPRVVGTVDAVFAPPT